MKNKGISLITLIITIVVVIILAAAVILTLGNNNPINDANLAAVMNNRDLMQSKILFHISKKTAASPERDLNAKTILITDINTKIIDDTVRTIEVTKDGKNIKLYKLDKIRYKNNIKDDIAEKPSTKSDWYVNEYGNLFLIYDFMTSVPDYMKDGDKLSKNVEDFVIVKGALLEESIVDSVVIGDVAIDGILNIDLSGVSDLNNAKIQINKLGTSDSSNKIDIDTSATSVNLQTEETGSYYAHVFIVLNDEQEFEIVKQIELIKSWDGTTATGFTGGTGTASDPYIISTAEELKYLQSQVASGVTYSGKYIELANDICLNDISNYENWSTQAPGHEWVPIGNSSKVFSGNFNGNNHKVVGMYICKSNENLKGLFGLTNGATIENLILENSYVKAYDYSGGIVGASEATNLNNLKSNNSIIIGNRRIGGVTGANVGGNKANTVTSFINCSNNSIVQGNDNIGGIAGFIGTNYDIAGGINRCAGQIIKVYNLTNSGNINGTQCTGGIVGLLYAISNSVYFCNSYNLGNVNGVKYIGGCIGCGMSTDSNVALPASLYVNNLYNVGKVVGTSSAGEIIGDISCFYGVAKIPSLIIKNCYSLNESIGTRYEYPKETATWAKEFDITEENIEVKTNTYMKSSNFVTLLNTNKASIETELSTLNLNLSSWSAGDTTSLGYPKFSN